MRIPGWSVESTIFLACHSSGVMCCVLPVLYSVTSCLALSSPDLPANRVLQQLVSSSRSSNGQESVLTWDPSARLRGGPGPCRCSSHTATRAGRDCPVARTTSLKGRARNRLSCANGCPPRWGKGDVAHRLTLDVAMISGGRCRASKDTRYLT